ncbi:hypothetical protein E1176_19055 [Fulvivirga sp. RKSG066]|uniref:hypothetical protein n=1 Tax=Fulvivirga aurantia TaxID=2529383 RepID=UPI0012BC2815|nr:hypothetical protein [Fulvivirga aurantia]MTI23136.1 hypothetical protein [Fulvivirga aurantia]
MKNFVVGLLLFVLFSCSSSKIEMFPDSKISYSSGDEILITRLEGIKTYYANDFYQNAVKVFSAHPSLKIVDESDMIYKFKTAGLELPGYDNYNKEVLKEMKEKFGLDFILTSKLLSMVTEINDFPTRQAEIELKLYDLTAGIPTVVMKIKTTMPPAAYTDGQGTVYAANVNSSISAADKAYTKAIKKYYKAFKCCF